MIYINIMEHTLLELLVFVGVALFGHIAHILTKLAKLEKKEKFSIKVWLKQNLFSTILGIVASIAGIFILDMMGQLNYGTSILVGYTGDSLIKNAATKFNTKTKDAGAKK